MPTDPASTRSERIQGAFIINARDREIVSWRAVLNAGVSGSDIRDVMLETIEPPFGKHRRCILSGC